MLGVTLVLILLVLKKVVFADVDVIGALVIQPGIINGCISIIFHNFKILSYICLKILKWEEQLFVIHTFSTKAKYEKFNLVIKLPNFWWLAILPFYRSLIFKIFFEDVDFYRSFIDFCCVLKNAATNWAIRVVIRLQPAERWCCFQYGDHTTSLLKKGIHLTADCNRYTF